MSDSKKKSLKVLIVLVVLAVIAAGGYFGWKMYTSRIEYRLGKAGYSKEETAQILDTFSGEQQEILANLSAVKDMLRIAKDERYQDDRFIDYLSGLAEGKDTETLLTDFDPLVIEFRAAEYYKEEYLQLYLDQKKYPDPAYFGGESPSGPTCQQIVIRINSEQVYSKIDGYDPALYDEYEAYRLKPDGSLVTLVETADAETVQNVVKHVNAVQLYKGEPSSEDEYLDLYVTYGEKHPDASVQDVISHVNTAGIYKDEPYYIDAYLDRYEDYRADNPDLDLYDVVLAVNAGIDKPFYTDTQHADMSKGYLVLVNKYFYVGDEDKPETEYLSGYGYGELEAEAAEHFRQMVDGAKADGIKIFSRNAYRTEAIQNTYYSGYVRDAGKAAADTYSARPGHSEHQVGLAVDINTASLSSHFENTAEYAWLVEHCAEYGFILRYLPGKQYITGYVYEPWHYRYVGVEYAQDIMDSGLTCEEWYAFYVANPDNE